MFGFKRKTTIGRLEKISFPEFNIANLIAKIDTGAFTGCIHADVLGEVGDSDSKRLQFKLLDPNHPEYDGHIYESDDYYIKQVRAANGQSDSRYIIKTEIVLGGKKMEIEIGLSNRADMKRPVLIGRKTLIKGDFVVDVALKNI